MKLPKKITAKWLRSRGACEEWIEAFATVFPKGCALTPGNIRHGLKANLDVYAAVDFLAPWLNVWDHPAVTELDRKVEALANVRDCAVEAAWKRAKLVGTSPSDTSEYFAWCHKRDKIRTRIWSRHRPALEAARLNRDVAALKIVIAVLKATS